METEVATCRWCRIPLRGRPYCYGGRAYHPRTGEECRVNYYGGFVCSRSCDFKASLELEQTMPGHGYEQKTLGRDAADSLKRNWPE